jgi:ribosomal protein S12 methylthiotransferase
MNRGVDRAKMQWAIDTFRKKIPSISIRTTVIVGFPGETESEFRDLMDFLKVTRFERLGAFMFSEEEGSRAYGLPDQIPQGLKQERFNAVMAQQRDISQSLNDEFIGKTIQVLIDNNDPKETNVYYGRTEADAPEVDGQVIVHSQSRLKPGDFVKVHITDALEYDLVGDCELA